MIRTSQSGFGRKRPLRFVAPSLIGGTRIPPRQTPASGEGASVAGPSRRGRKGGRSSLSAARTPSHARREAGPQRGVFSLGNGPLGPRGGPLPLQKGPLPRQKGLIQSRGGAVLSHPGLLHFHKGSVLSRGGLIPPHKGLIPLHKGVILSQKGSRLFHKGLIQPEKGSILFHPPPVPSGLNVSF